MRTKLLLRAMLVSAALATFAAPADSEEAAPAGEYCEGQMCVAHWECMYWCENDGARCVGNKCRDAPN